MSTKFQQTYFQQTNSTPSESTTNNLTMELEGSRQELASLMPNLISTFNPLVHDGYVDGVGGGGMGGGGGNGYVVSSEGVEL